MELATFTRPALDLMDHLAWRPPAIVQPVADIRGSTDALRSELVRQVEEGERKFHGWIKRGRKLKTHLWAVTHEIPPAPEHLELISEIVSKIESASAEDARHISRLRKLFRGQVREAYSISGDIAEMLHAIYGRALAIAERELEERLELALFLRALRASIAPNEADGTTFEDAGELERHLRSVVAS